MWHTNQHHQITSGEQDFLLHTALANPIAKKLVVSKKEAPVISRIGQSVLNICSIRL